MGRITKDLLDLLQIRWQYLPDDLEEAKHKLIQANQHIDHNRTFFFVVKKGTFDEEVLQKQQSSIHLNQIKVQSNGENQMPTRHEVLTVINALKDCKTVQLATTGII